MNKLRAFTISLTLLTALLLSCKHDPILTPGTATVCFDSQILPVIQTSCAKSGCHDTGGEKQALKTYNDIIALVTPGKPLQSKLYTIITNNPNLGNVMPPKPDSPLSSKQMDDIEIWILQGAVETHCPCDSANVTFSGSVQPIINNNCVSCHGSSNPSGGISLVDYNTVKASVDGGRFVGAIEQLQGFSPMPKIAGVKLSECNIGIINKWINQGMPNN